MIFQFTFSLNRIVYDCVNRLYRLVVTDLREKIRSLLSNLAVSNTVAILISIFACIIF